MLRYVGLTKKNYPIYYHFELWVHNYFGSFRRKLKLKTNIYYTLYSRICTYNIYLTTVKTIRLQTNITILIKN